ncbi:MAG: metal ABC transporter permease [Phycisphaerales bacterium]|nr:metal ABC transporter permease [Phycisphaerales bacterium]
MSLTDTSISFPPWSQVFDVLAFRQGYNTSAVVLGTTLLGLAAGTVGVFTLLRRRALMGDVLAHATLPGIALAFLAATALGMEGRSLPVLLLGAAATAVLAAAAVQAVTRHTRLTEDTAMAAALSVFFGVGVVLLMVIARMPVGNQGGLKTFILGQTAAMTGRDTMLIGGLALAAFVVTGLVYKELRLVCFDAGYARARGWPVGALDLLMMALVVTITVVGLQAVGLVLVIALVIIPPTAARFWTSQLGVMLPVSAAIGAISGYLGAAVSALIPRLPTGAIIVLTAGAVFIVSMLAAPHRGLLATALRALALRRRTAEHHVLRALFESRETGAPPSLRELRGIGGAVARLDRRGLLTGRGASMALTARGLSQAAQITRNHRLWEQFLVDYAELAPSHVDFSADRVEHVLTPDLVAELEAAAAARGRLPTPAGAELIPSVHPLRSPDAGGGP